MDTTNRIAQSLSDTNKINYFLPRAQGGAKKRKNVCCKDRLEEKNNFIYFILSVHLMGNKIIKVLPPTAIIILLTCCNHVS